MPGSFPNEITVVRNSHAYLVSPSSLQMGDVVEMPEDAPYSWGQVVGQREDGSWDLIPCLQPYCEEMDYGNPLLNLGIRALVHIAHKLEN